jgi:hypothetical protein
MNPYLVFFCFFEFFVIGFLVMLYIMERLKNKKSAKAIFSVKEEYERGFKA